VRRPKQTGAAANPALATSLIFGREATTKIQATSKTNKIQSAARAEPNLITYYELCHT